jgi:WD40 repeat protein
LLGWLIVVLAVLLLLLSEHVAAQDISTIEIVPQIGHTIAIRSVAISRDGKYILSGGSEHVAKLWDVATSTLLRTFYGHLGEVWSVAFSPDGQRILTGSRDNTLKLWDPATGRVLRTMTHTSVLKVSPP